MLIRKAGERIGQYLAFLENNAYRELAGLEFEMFETEKTWRRPPEDAVWQKVETPCPWGREWACFWFRAEFTAPKTRGALFLSVLPNADSLVFIDGKPAGAFNIYHTKLRIAGDGLRHTLHIESYSGHEHGGCGPFEGPSIFVNLGKTLPQFPNMFEGGVLLERREAVYALYYDVAALFDLAKKLDDASLRKARILKGLYDALLEDLSLNSEGAELEQAAAQAARRIAPLLMAKNGSTVPSAYLIGHAHIDHAWLWHIGETERKAARTYANMAAFIREYPELVFIQSQPCQLEIVKNEYPDVFAAVKSAYQSGNWEPNGGMWVEADCNIPSGESLVRQFLVGKAAVKAMLDYEADTLWLPDVFGYAAALPQILAGCRIKYFVTSKIGWNDTTRFPYDTFMWRGIDGTGIQTHFISSKYSGYNGRVKADDLINAWGDVQHKEIQSGYIRSIGEGDGGGGTLRSDIEMARRFKDLEGMPKTVWVPVSRALDEIFADSRKLPEWRGELYLELHRGTYTTQARTKRWNRRLEFALRHTEWLASAARAGGAGEPMPYPRAELLAAWKQVLTHQFHDIIPGSSINRVYEEAEAVYQKVYADLSSIAVNIRRTILQSSGAEALVFNDLSWERNDPLVCPASVLAGVSALRAADGAVFPVQRFTGLDGEALAIVRPRLPPLGWKGFSCYSPQERPQNPSGTTGPFSYADNTLETPLYRVHFDRHGRIDSFFDKAMDRQLIRQGGFFNAFCTAEDVPVYWSAWDIDSDWTKSIREETGLAASEPAARGPVCLRLRQTYRLSPVSTLTQDMVFYAEERRVDFDTKVDWHERQRLLKVAFDTNIDAPVVRCEVQYGHVFRNTHRNLPQDRAKFEICSHKWLALEEAGGGLALLNDCKYGCDVEGGRIRLSLLRSPVAPDPKADQGEHRFTYSLLPFSGAFTQSRVIQSAYELNAAAVVESARAQQTHGTTGAEYSLCAIDSEAIIIECIKAPETGIAPEGEGLICRLYESRGGHARGVLRFARTIAAAYTTDMLEENPQPMRAEGAAIPLEFKPFEIKTVAVRFDSFQARAI
jgi:alpha-mannosidase